ncbi:MAG: menaquinone-specific isochorismate synthase [Thermoleophilaceae bacterium]|jgi:salicylate biosynthesis isochorismate synthase/menaquinone-specific isochorismate synthase|nr:menaquinone-specific isochorismate synthase [Thermoleophilaceae bacterium]
MSFAATRARNPFELSAEARETLAERIEQATARAPALAALTLKLPADLDLTAAVMRARRPDDRFFCFEQPDRDGFVLAGLGCAAALESRGAGRFREVAVRARTLGRGAFVDDPSRDAQRPAAAGPVFVGGFAFADDGGSTPEWASLAPASLVLPEVSLARHRGEARMTVSVVADGGEAPDTLLERLLARVAELEPASLPLIDPDPVHRTRVASAAPPSHYEQAVERAVERIRAGELQKVVLAREVRAHAAAVHDPGAVVGALRDAFPACFCWCVGTPELAFVGASPELLVRRDGARAQTVALAGTTRRSADPAVDDHLGEQLLRSVKDREEQAIVARGIERTLEPVSVWVTAADEPVLVKVQNVQHLATPIRAQLADPLPAVELAGMLLPTPAVGGEPREAALPLIPALEGLDRGWYAGAVGWTDLGEDGEFCVAVRCALLRGRLAHLYAGCGIVRDSVPAEELAESEVKFQALLPLLS